MIKHLVIKNFALIDNLEIDFFDGFSVITGETGAGKSIVIGAISLILGKRADLQSLKNKLEKCVVEGIFKLERSQFESFFLQNDLDLDPENTILRREILPSGKSRAFINDSPVNLNVLQELSAYLIDIHSQHQTREILNEEYQLTDNPLTFSIIEINDSRCPSDVICIWQGKAELKIEVISPVSGTLILNTYNHLNDTLGNYSFELKDVSPYPISTATIDPEDYIVTLKISEITD